MKSAIKTYLSLFLLGIFLFAYAEKNVHDILHADDPHCFAQNVKHIHNQEHHCFICDFDIPVFDGSTTHIESSFQRFATASPFIVSDNKLTPNFHFSFFNKGPPAIV